MPSLTEDTSSIQWCSNGKKYIKFHLFCLSQNPDTVLKISLKLLPQTQKHNQGNVQVLFMARGVGPGENTQEAGDVHKIRCGKHSVLFTAHWGGRYDLKFLITVDLIFRILQSWSYITILQTKLQRDSSFIHSIGNVREHVLREREKKPNNIKQTKQ